MSQLAKEGGKTVKEYVITNQKHRDALFSNNIRGNNRMVIKKISVIILALSLVIIPVQQANAAFIIIPVIIGIVKALTVKASGVVASKLTTKGLGTVVPKINTNTTRRAVEQASSTKNASRLSRNKTEQFVKDKLDDDD